MPLSTTLTNGIQNTVALGGTASAIVGAAATGAAIDLAANVTTDTSIGAMMEANNNQNRMAVVSAAMQTAAAARAMMMQTLRDLIKDAKDGVKDQGEAGHKP